MTLPMKIIQSIEFEPITEDYIKDLLRKDIEAQLPNGAVIKSIEFVRKLQPTRIEAEVTAVFGDTPQPVVAPEPVKTEPEVTKPISVADMLQTNDDDDFDESECVAPPMTAPWDAKVEEEEEEEVVPPKPAMTVADLFKAGTI